MSRFLARLVRWVASFLARPRRERPPAPEAPASLVSAQPPKPIAEPPAEPESPMVPLAAIGQPRVPSEPAAAVPPVEEEPRAMVTPAPREETDVFIGLDFGTAGTKVIVRAPLIAGGWAAAVDFGSLGHPSCSLILPSLVHTDGDGQAALGPGLREGHAMPNSLKVRLMDAEADLDAKAEAVTFLTLVMRFARDWFCREHLAILGPRKPRWRANLGIPSAGYDDDRIRATFGLVGSAAWAVAFQGGPVTTQAARAALAAARSDGDELPVGTIPEVVAQALGYARSYHRQDGLHLLVDVGASTLDVCAFVLHDARREDNYELLNAVVAKLGALELHRGRIECLGYDNCSSSVLALDILDPFCRIPESARDYVSPAYSRLDVILKNEKAFKAQCYRAVFSSLHDVRKRRDPNSQKWTEGLPTFLCGGGAALRLYHEVLSSVSHSAQRQWSMVAPLKIHSLPRPTALSNRGLGEELFHRLSVAYGLAFERLDIGTINRPSDIGDIAPPPRKRPKDFISKDQV